MTAWIVKYREELESDDRIEAHNLTIEDQGVLVFRETSKTNSVVAMIALDTIVSVKKELPK